MYAKRGTIVRVLYVAASAVWCALTLNGRLSRRRVVTLCYHGVMDHEREVFARQMRKIGDRAVAPDGSQAGGASPLRVAVTFDDAFDNLRRNAFPTLAGLGIPAAVFAVSSNMGEKPRWAMRAGHPEADEPIMTMDALRDETGELVEVGSHTVTHAKLTDLDDGAVERELRESKERLEEALGRAVRLFAFPYGAGGQREIELAHRVGYARVYTLDPAPDRGDGFAMGRFLMSPDAWPIEFALTVRGGYGWLAVARRVSGLLRPTRAVGDASGRATEVVS